MKTLFPFLALTLGASLTHASVIYSGAGNGDVSFGGAIGNGALSLDFDGNNTITGTVTRGTSGNFNDILVIYFDSVAGGFTDTSTFTDEGGGGDSLRQAISGYDNGNRSALSFPSGFAADHAIALDPSGVSFGGLWDLDNASNFTFSQDVNLSPTGSNNAAAYTFDFDLADIGITFGDSADFVTTYIAASAFRSTESVGNGVSGTPGWNAFSASPAQSFAAVPEASEALIVLLGMTGLVAHRRRMR